MNSIIEIAEAVRTSNTSALDVLEEYIARIARHEPKINAFAYTDFEAARAVARSIDEKVKKGISVGPLAGVPFGVKDLEDCAGMPTGLGCVFYTGRPPVERDMIHVARLRNADAVPVGKTTTAELGFAGDCHTRACGTTRNPWKLDRTPGGSSGGSAAAVAAGMVPFATGSDGGGSIRGPAAFTGLVGFKPSHGRIPNANGMSENSCYGSLNTCVADSARCLDVMSGPDDHDRMTLPAAGIRYEEAIGSADVSGLKFAWSDDLGFAVVEREVIEIAHAAALDLIRAAHLVRSRLEVKFSNLMPAMMHIYSNRLRSRFEYDGFLPDRFDELADTTKIVLREVRDVTLEDEIRSRDAIISLEKEVAEFFSEADFLLCPATACVAFNAEGPFPRVIDGRDAEGTYDAPMTPFANYCWNPSISVPAGVTRAGLPVGLLITGRRHRDEQVLRLARIFEQARPWPRIAPGW